MSAAPETLPRKTPAQGPGVLTSHLLAYGELVTALLQAWQRSLSQRLAGAVLAVLGISTAAMLFTIGAITAAWSTPYRWLVWLGIAGLYLVAGGVGVWLFVRRSAVPNPASILVNELGKDIELLSEGLRERRDER